MNKSFYAITQEGFRRITLIEEFIGPEIAMLSNLAAATPVIIKNFMPRTAMATGRGFMSMARELKEIKIKTIFRPMKDVDDKAILMPVWKKPGSEMELIWSPPFDMKLFFVCGWEVANAHLQVNKTRAYLVALDVNGITHLLPLPNLYEDGNICLGNNEAPQGDSMITLFQSALDIFERTQWNTDLLTSESQIQSRRMFRFDADGKQLPPTENWPGLCYRTNHVHYEFVGTLWKK